MDIQKLVDDVTALIARKPSQAKRILQAVADGMELYERDQIKTRNQSANAAMISMLTILNFKNLTDLPWLIDMAYCLFPTGDASRYSPIQTQFWEHFLMVVKKTKMDVIGYKGAHYTDWWNNVVKPALKEKEI